MKRFLLPALMSIILVMPINAQFATIADAMRSLPVMPTVDQIITPEAKQAADKSVYAPYKQAVEQYMLTIDKENIELNVRMERARTKQVQRNQAHARTRAYIPYIVIPPTAYIIRCSKCLLCTNLR